MKFLFSQTSLTEIRIKSIPSQEFSKDKSIFSVSLIVDLKVSSLSENVGMTVVACLLCLLEDWMRVSYLYLHFKGVGIQEFTFKFRERK